MDNEEYATTGGQTTPTAHGADLDAAARAMGIAATATVRTEEELRRRAVARAEAEPGPWVIVAKVTESAPTAKPPLDCVFIKQRFMAAIGNRKRRRDGKPVVTLGDFVVDADPPPAARGAAARALLDTVGVTLAGAAEPASRIVQRVVEHRRRRPVPRARHRARARAAGECGARQRHRGARARLRRHVLRVARAPERAARRGRARRRRNGGGVGPRAARRLRRRLRAGRAARAAR